MGYRSQVCFEIVGPKNKLEMLRLEANDLFETSDLDEDEDIVVHYDGLCSLRYYNGWVKWYDEFLEVKNFKRIWRLAEKWGLEGKFVRVGEEIGDVEEDFINNAYHLGISPTQSIWKDW